MAGRLEDVVLDNGLTILDTAPTHIVICSGEPTTITHASVAGNTAGGTSVLGWKSLAAGSVFGAPGAAGATGRKVSSVTVTDGTFLTSGTANWWAIIAGTSTFYAHNSLSSSQVVTSGNSFSLNVFDITIPNA